MIDDALPAAGFAGGDLVIAVGGTTIVATDSVLAEAELMRSTQAQAAHWREQVNAIRWLNPDGPQKLHPLDPGITLVWAWIALGELEHTSGNLAAELVTAAERYGAVERVLHQLMLVESAKLGYLVGQFPLVALLLGVPAVAHGALAWRVWNCRPEAGKGRANDARLLTNPAVVLLAKLAVSSLDDVGAGALGVHPGVNLLLGDTGIGVFGVSTTALTVLALSRRGGLFHETPVRVQPVGAPQVTQPPSGINDLAQRIPPAVRGQPQMKIENYGTPANPSWAVYVGGTTDWATVATDEPWDLTANVAAMAGQNAGSFAAVMQSMHAAGIGRDDPVVITGHSQGGLVATQVAASGAFAVRAVATFGSPETAVPVPRGVATLTVQHTDDVVTALGGASLVDSNDRLLVRREAYGAVPVPPGLGIPAHHLDRYRETAQLIDASPQENVRDFRDTVTGVLGRDTGTSVLWHGQRVPKPPSTR